MRFLKVLEVFTSAKKDLYGFTKISPCVVQGFKQNFSRVLTGRGCLATLS